MGVAEAWNECSCYEEYNSGPGALASQPYSSHQGISTLQQPARAARIETWPTIIFRLKRRRSRCGRRWPPAMLGDMRMHPVRCALNRIQPCSGRAGDRVIIPSWGCDVRDDDQWLWGRTASSTRGSRSLSHGLALAAHAGGCSWDMDPKAELTGLIAQRHLWRHNSAPPKFSTKSANFLLRCNSW